MKASKVLGFILLAMLSLGMLAWIFPKDDIHLGKMKLTFVDLDEFFKTDSSTAINVEEVISQGMGSSAFDKAFSVIDSLKVYEQFARENNARIYYPQGQEDYFHSLFEMMETAVKDKKLVRIVHYGDSQIEMDRISNILRQKLQEKFGGGGPGLIPAIQTVPTLTVGQDFYGDLHRYAIYGLPEDRAEHRRYGILAQMSSLNGSAVISFNTRKSAFDNAKKFSRIRLLVGNGSAGFKAEASIGGSSLGEKDFEQDFAGFKMISWSTSAPVSSASLNLQGVAEIYGIALDQKYGIALDNIALRGCSGTIFTGIETQSFAPALSALDTRLIILQFGGNVMPVINDSTDINNYQVQLARQIKHLKKVYPQSLVLFVGPSDMSKKVNGKMQTWPLLPEVNEMIKELCASNGVAYWDMFHAMGGRNAMPQWVEAKPSLAAPDYIHFTEKGANHIASILYSSLMNDYQIFRIRRQIDKAKEDMFLAKNQNKEDEENS